MLGKAFDLLFTLEFLDKKDIFGRPRPGNFGVEQRQRDIGLQEKYALNGLQLFLLRFTFGVLSLVVTLGLGYLIWRLGSTFINIDTMPTIALGVLGFCVASVFVVALCALAIGFFYVVKLLGIIKEDDN